MIIGFVEVILLRHWVAGSFDTSIFLSLTSILMVGTSIFISNKIKDKRELKHRVNLDEKLDSIITSNERIERSLEKTNLTLKDWVLNGKRLEIKLVNIIDKLVPYRKKFIIENAKYKKVAYSIGEKVASTYTALRTGDIKKDRIDLKDKQSILDKLNVIFTAEPLFDEIKEGILDLCDTYIVEFNDSKKESGNSVLIGELFESLMINIYEDFIRGFETKDSTASKSKNFTVARDLIINNK